MKRVFDVVLATLGIVLLLPFLLMAAVLVRIDSPGPVIFRQRRMGRDFEPFEILKFRTMHLGAEKKGAGITSGGDPRVTRIGRLLRGAKIDELPQLVNVVRGEMSLVGPRPELPRYVEIYRDEYREILRARPGMTDPASIRFRDEATLLAQSAAPEEEYIRRILPVKIALARDYVRRATLLLDLRLIGLTIAHVVGIGGLLGWDRRG